MSDHTSQANQQSNNNAGDHSNHGNGHGHDPHCFMEETLIRTPSGDVCVEGLKAGDLVVLADNTVAPIRWLGRSTVSAPFIDPIRMLPVRIKAGALARERPQRDLLVSPGHALLIDEILVEAAALVNGVSILRETNVAAQFTYYHIELEHHALILAEGALTETFVDNTDRLTFDNWMDHELLHPEPVPIEEMAYPRAKSQRQVPKATHARLVARSVVVDDEIKAHAA